MTTGKSCSRVQDPKSPQISRDMGSFHNLNESYRQKNTQNESSSTIDDNIDRIRNSEANTDRLKIAIYMEAAKVYRGRGVERRFADYLDGLGRYLSLDTSVRSNGDVATNGINNVLQVFLTTKKLRKLHNLYMKSLMSQCLQTKVSRERAKCHIPFQWRGMIKVYKTETANKNTLTRSLSETHDTILNYVQANFGSNSIVWRQTGIARLSPSISTPLNFKNPTRIHSEEHQSTRIPGVLEIDHIAHHAIENEDYCLSQSALWAISIGVKEYISKILEDVTSHFDAQNDEEVSRKPRCLSCYDILQVINAKVKSNETANLRVSWEQSVSNACLTMTRDIPLNSFSETEKIHHESLESAQNSVLIHHDGNTCTHNTKFANET